MKKYIFLLILAVACSTSIYCTQLHNLKSDNLFKIKIVFNFTDNTNQRYNFLKLNDANKYKAVGNGKIICPGCGGTGKMIDWLRRKGLPSYDSYGQCPECSGYGIVDESRDIHLTPDRPIPTGAIIFMSVLCILAVGGIIYIGQMMGP